MRVLGKTFLLVLVLAASIGTAGCGEDDTFDATLTVNNASSYSILEFYLSPASQATWGSDLLGSDILEPGDSFILNGIDCDDYDIRMIDEDLDECVLDAIELCWEDAVWTFDDTDLALCSF